MLVETINRINFIFYKQRRKTLLVEMERRYKAGGIIDRRFGENGNTVGWQGRSLFCFHLTLYLSILNRSHKILVVEKYDI